MKKLCIGLFSLVSVAAVAQDTQTEPLTSKRGVPILPEAGEWAIGVDATPFLDYLGNFFHGDDFNDSPFLVSSSNDVALVGKYMNDSQNAYRVRFALNRNSGSLRNIVDDNLDDEEATVEDKITVSEMNVFLGGGIEKRRGKGRLQGIYGAEVGVGFRSGSVKFDYGNPLSDDNTSATITSFNYNDPHDIWVSGENTSSSRTTEEKTGTQIIFGVTGFIGVEYFIAPKVSLGGELGYGISLSTSPKGKETFESWDFVDDELVTDTNEGYLVQSNFDIGTRPAGSIYLIFYF